jgi:uncharacterized protein (DUF433 family)
MIVMGDLSLTTSEAGYVLERSSVAINKAVDTGLIRAGVRRGPSGQRTSRTLGKPELLFLKLADVLDKDLTVLGQRKLYEAIRRLPGQAHQLRVGVLTVDIASFDRAIEERVARLVALRERVALSGSGEPVIRGTAVPVYQIAGLAKGQEVGEILEDYPSLTRDQVESAVEYAKAYPKKGRPYPARSFARMVADLGLDEIETERTGEGPRLIAL